ncbi:MAG TPA: hypothetical protein VHB49_13285 [Bradyrhizobium sp.]|nr:hypothetical protein [Bradyrhizobium sp.]
MKRAGNFIIFIIAALYFALDAIFATVAIPLARWIGAQWMFARLQRWILSLGPYPTLLLFLLPLIILEPVKPLAAYLAGTGHMMRAAVLLAIGEILKLVLVERMFSVSRDKLLSIPAFAWAYGKYCTAKAWLTSLEAWRLALRWYRLGRLTLHRFTSSLRKPQRSRRALFQSW